MTTYYADYNPQNLKSNVVAELKLW